MLKLLFMFAKVVNTTPVQAFKHKTSAEEENYQSPGFSAAAAKQGRGA